ncbi:MULTISPECIES: hypothetical protein [Ramlibacter]|uniref:Histidine kinase n=1 Tax=Ramlibacter pinisoli TaxID=2682844 RepID=A0A6N8IN42_9BURK|nr:MULTISPECIES: hypothetical protein [Ramlibacter]MBA2960655.1 hypothetical protein [Ramlibacter sp. CGMCC 1.13660]MVQ27985.1 hypothetical protein [Ramlibacter pinisoli]
MTASSPPEARLLRVESARYALLRRLAAGMRHQLVMHLQPIGMVTEVMARRLRQPEPDLAQLHDGVHKVNTYSRAAVDACLDVITWLAPDPAATLSVDAAAKECLELLRSNLSFRGFALRSEVQALPQPVGRTAVRMLLAGSLLALTDAAKAPADLVLSATADEYAARLTIELRPSQADVPPAGDPPYRALRWEEIDAMADAEDVRIERTPTSVTLTFNVLE